MFKVPTSLFYAKARPTDQVFLSTFKHSWCHSRDRRINRSSKILNVVNFYFSINTLLHVTP